MAFFRCILTITFIELKVKKYVHAGSEIEVDENMRLSFRRPFTVNLICDYNCFATPCKLNFQLVDDSPFGYVELTSPREIFSNIYRKRLSTYIQCAPYKTNGVTQTMIEPVMNKSTMCPREAETKVLPKHVIENFFAKLNIDYIFDVMQTNFFMDLCNKDYNFENALQMQIYQFPLFKLSFHDVFSCRGMKVSCVSWNAMKSGLIAASYMKELGTVVVRRETLHNPLNTSARDHLILIWSYTDTIRPRLYLHCIREVTFVSFCSYNANIVVGGCKNGQIIVWDISGRMERAEISKSLTRQQISNRLILDQYMTWMKQPPDVQHVYPVVISKIEISHSSPVSYIEWLPPDQHITRNGSFKKIENNEVHMQFLSCSMEGGYIDFWDIGVSQNAIVDAKQKRVVRLSSVPSALKKFVSPLKGLAKDFIPVFRVSVLNPDTRKPLVLNRLHEKRWDIEYQALNPETEDDIYNRTTFKCISPDDNNDPVSNQKFTCATILGHVAEIQWEGHSYNQGCLINSNAAEVRHVVTYHDGPVLVCMESPFIKDLLLTIGGKVFAIWHNKDLQVPIFWRKSLFRYVTGTWLTTQSFQFCLTRADNFKEIWDLMDDSKNPMKIIKGKGRATHSVYNDFARKHTKKGTFVETNIAGEICVFSVIGSYKNIKAKEVDAVIDYLRDLKSRKTWLVNWVDSIKSKFTAVAEKVVQGETPVVDTAMVQAKQEVIVDDAAPKKCVHFVQLEINKWQAKEEAFMQKILLANKHIKLDQIIQNSDLIRQTEEMRKKNSKKCAEELKNKEATMQAWWALLIPKQDLIKFKRKITVTFTKEMISYMKQSYIQNYKDIEMSTLGYIKINEHKYLYNWAELNNRAQGSWTRNHSLKLMDIPSGSSFLL